MAMKYILALAALCVFINPAYAQTGNAAKAAAGSVNQYNQKYKKTPPPPEGVNLLMPGAYQVSLLPGADGQAVLRLFSPVTLSGCVTIKAPEVKTKHYGPNLSFEIGQPDITIMPKKRYAHYECPTGPHYTQVDLPLDTRQLGTQGIRQITLKSSGPGDIFDVQMDRGQLSLVPRTVHTFRPRAGQAGVNPLAIKISAPEKEHQSDHSMMMDHGHHDMAMPLRVSTTLQSPLRPGQTSHVLLKLVRADNDQPVGVADLAVVHTQRLHLLVIDPSLSDYHHIHPVPTQNPGEWEFDFTPRKDSVYKIWADVTLADTKTQSYIPFTIGPTNAMPGPVDQTAAAEATVEGYHFTLRFDAPPGVGKMATGRLAVTDANGKPVDQLQPVMGAFAHIVGFDEKARSVLHMHPMGQEPTAEDERGGPELMFHFNPEKPGFVKIFAQVRIHDKDIFAPFGVHVE